MEIVTNIAPIALAIIMLGLGASLTIDDFLRVVKNPKDFFYWFYLSVNCFTNCCLSTYHYLKCTN
jgi:predicted Na+-dependent transporter